MRSSFILVLLSFIAQVMALTISEPFAIRAFGGGGGNKRGKGGAGAGTKNSTSVASSSTSTTSTPATVAATTTTAAPASTTTAAAGNSSDPQSSLTLDPGVISTGFENDGQDVPTAGQVASLTSSNNFINFCQTVPNLPLTNGKQIATGSCNTAPMGIIAASTNMPSSKFTNPKNGDTIAANVAFTISMAVRNFQPGFFVNAQENYFSAPQQVNAQGQIIGHSHVVVEQITALDQTTPTDPTKFAFFKGLNAPAQNGILTADVTNGLPAGIYKLSSINTAANHQPCLVAIAQHGSIDDAVYFTISDGGAPAAGTATAAANSTASATASPAAGGKKGRFIARS